MYTNLHKGKSHKLLYYFFNYLLDFLLFNRVPMGVEFARQKMSTVKKKSAEASESSFHFKYLELELSIL